MKKLPKQLNLKLPRKQPLSAPPSSSASTLTSHEVKKNEEELWHTWKKNGKRPEDLRPLLGSLQPLVHKTINTYQTADVSHQALKVQAENQLIQGLHTYDPKKSSLSTHLGWQMRGVGRFVEKNQNVARIPGTRIRYVGRMQNAERTLEEELGRAPTLNELAARAKMKPLQVEKLKKELHTVRLTGMAMDETGAPMSGDMADFTISADREKLDLIYNDLTPMEKQVVDLSLGSGGAAPIGSTTQLAMKLKVSPARISNVRASIAKKMEALRWMR